MVSFPPLIDMLKFSGYSYLIRGQSARRDWLRRRRRTIQTRAKKLVASGVPRAPPFSFGSAVLATVRPNCKLGLRVDNDARTGMPFGIPKGAMCVQRFDDSRNSAIRITYRISLRSSSMPEPRDPLLKVLVIGFVTQTSLFNEFYGVYWRARVRKQTPRQSD